MYPKLGYHLAQAHLAGLRRQAQRDTLARAARRARTHQPGQPAPAHPSAVRRLPARNWPPPGIRGWVSKPGLHSAAPARCRGVAMRRFAMAGAVLTAGTVLAVLTPVAGTTPAWADGPQHVKDTFSFDFVLPAGTFCDFDQRVAGTGTDNLIIFPGKTIDQVVLQITHTNEATGFALTETDNAVETFTAADGQTKEVGIFWHLRTADGKIVVVQSGQLVFSATGEVLRFTPGINPDEAAVICPALGGNPAS
jgi:hypothetical protein